MSRLAELVAQQRASLEAEHLLMPNDYLALAKPIPMGAVETFQVQSDAVPQGPVLEPDVGAEGIIGPYHPPLPNRHLHVRETLLLALKVLEANQREGFVLLPDEQQLVNDIARFASAPPATPI